MIWLASGTIAFNVALDGTLLSKGRNHFSPLFMSESDGMENCDKNEDTNVDDMPIIAQSTVKIDDGGSDLTDRFKYKVKRKRSLKEMF